MKMIKPKVIITGGFDPNETIKKIEEAGRTCYQSEGETREQFVRGLVKRGHTSVLEHASISFRIITDRGVSHELVRHRIASYSQESTRYVKYNDDVQFIKHINEPLQDVICEINQRCEDEYNKLLEAGAKPQIARQALNNGVKTEVYTTMNMRSLINFFDLRADVAAHPYMKEIAIPFLLEMKKMLPCIFENIKYDEKFYEERLKGFIDGMVVIDGVRNNNE